MTNTEQTRALLARHYNYRTLDRMSAWTGRLCQRAGVSYRGRVTPDERAAVQAATVGPRPLPVLVIHSDQCGKSPRASDSIARETLNPKAEALSAAGVTLLLVVVSAIVAALLLAPFVLSCGGGE